MTGRAAGLLLLSFLRGLAPAQDVPAPDDLAPLRDWVQKLVADGATPGLSIAMIRSGALQWAEGFGHAVVEEGRPATADTIYRLASISKPLTATGLMVLVDQGRIDLDTPANRYLGDAKLTAREGKAEDMTIRRLANHTAGLGEHWCFYYPGAPDSHVEDAIRRYGFAAWPPGSRWCYSNLGFGILAHITGRVSGKGWRVFMQDAVYDPLGMDRTFDGVRPGREADAAASYRRDVTGGWTRLAPYRFDHDGASAICSSVRDMARFVLMHLGDGAIGDTRILSEDAAKAMRRLTAHRSATEGTGIGWAVGKERGYPSFGHSGGMPGVSTNLVAFPEERHAVLVFLNCDARGVTQRVTRRAIAALFPEPAADPGPSADSPQPSLDPAAFEGNWKGELLHPDGPIPFVLRVDGGGRARAKLGAQGWRPLDDFTCREDTLSGTFPALLRTFAGFHDVPRIDLRLRRHGDHLSGVAIARAPSTFALSHYVSLTR